MNQSYNLIEEPWIPVQRMDAAFERVGIRKALETSRHIRGIAASNPIDAVTLARFLMAVLHWCRPLTTPVELRSICDSRIGHGIPEDWLIEKLGTPVSPSHLFDLLAQTGGFYQDDSIGDSTPVSATNLFHDLPSATNIAHFRHTRDGRDGLCLACCAIGLVRWSAVASGGTAGRRQSMSASLNGNAPTYAVPTEGSLLESMISIWPGTNQVAGDVPVWGGAEQGSPTGFEKGLTWKSRSIFLAPSGRAGRRDLSPGICCYCGRRTGRSVRYILFRPGWKRPSNKEPWSNDPHLLTITQKEKTNRKGAEERVSPVWPGPNSPVGDHSAIWRLVMKGLLERAAAGGLGGKVFHTLLLSTSQALYKDAATLKIKLPDLHPQTAQQLLGELQWIDQTSSAFTPGQTSAWRTPVKHNPLVSALSKEGSKGNAIRSSLSAFSIGIQRDLEKRFTLLIGQLSQYDQTDKDACSMEFDRWRNEVCQIFERYVTRTVETTNVLWTLRGRETERLARESVRDALRNIKPIISE